MITELHFATDAAFKKAGIEIAYPQRDIHLDAKQPLNVGVLSDQAAAPRDHQN
ncbi:MAG: hypothetical protein HKN85_12410 [Gammaproteobacteria bacterium]|nr:hypothetical protein [Gammaproteobacteria bacterium]